MKEEKHSPPADSKPAADPQEEAAKDQYLRTLADLENTRKRLHREKEEFVRFAAEGFIRELLPILDSLDQALVTVDKQSDPEAVIKGVHLIHRQLLGMLAKEGVKRIPTVGEMFDPMRHEAVGHVEVDDGTAENTIVEEVHTGYMMNGKVIRPAMVRVAKAAHSKQQTAQNETQTDNTEKNSQKE